MDCLETELNSIDGIFKSKKQLLAEYKILPS